MNIEAPNQCLLELPSQCRVLNTDPSKGLPARVAPPAPGAPSPFQDDSPPPPDAISGKAITAGVVGMAIVGGLAWAVSRVGIGRVISRTASRLGSLGKLSRWGAKEETLEERMARMKTLLEKPGTKPLPRAPTPPAAPAPAASPMLPSAEVAEVAEVAAVPAATGARAPRLVATADAVVNFETVHIHFQRICQKMFGVSSINLQTTVKKALRATKGDEADAYSKVADAVFAKLNGALAERVYGLAKKATTMPPKLRKAAQAIYDETVSADPRVARVTADNKMAISTIVHIVNEFAKSGRLEKFLTSAKLGLPKTDEAKEVIKVIKELFANDALDLILEKLPARFVVNGV